MALLVIAVSGACALATSVTAQPSNANFSLAANSQAANVQAANLQNANLPASDTVQIQQAAFGGVLQAKLYSAPEVGSLVLLGTGLFGIAGFLRWKMRAK